MIVFLDTSSLVKLYIAEEGSDNVRSAVESYVEIAVSSVAYVEMYSALSRRVREGSIGPREIKKISVAFEADWLRFGKVPMDDSLLHRAGKICLDRSVRALDAIQLATALVVSENQEEPLIFLTSDKRLESAARLEKLRTQI